jgi:hypothetical protein
MILLFTHITGCFWYYLTKFPADQHWDTNFEDADTTISDLYILSLYWAISTICTVGFGDVVPVNNLEIIINIVWITIGVGFYSYTIGTLSNIL